MLNYRTSYGNENSNNERDSRIPFIEEENSLQLLIEIMTQNPMVISCLKIVQAACLSQGVTCKINGKSLSKKFAQHVETYYTRFCEQCIRSIFMCGFVPWRLRKLETGDCVPEVLPLGSFTWSVITNTAEARNKRHTKRKKTTDGTNDDKQAKIANDKTDKKPEKGKETKEDEPTAKDPRDFGDKKKNMKQPSAMYQRQQRALKRQADALDADDSKSLRYEIRIVASIGVLDKEVEIYEYTQPVFQTRSTQLTTPMYSILSQYRSLKNTRLMHDHAENWNVQAKLACSYTVPKDVYSLQEGNPILNDWTQPQNRMGMATDTNLPVEIEDNVYLRDAITERVVNSKSSFHNPIVYSLPKNTVLQAVPKLEPIRNIPEMEIDFARSLSGFFGIPVEMIAGGDVQSNASLGHASVFTSNMMDMCKHLEALMLQVYIASYGDTDSEVEFKLFPTSRLSVQTVDDIAKLVEMGLISTENAHQLSNMMIGSDLKMCTGNEPNSSASAKMFMTPQNKKEDTLTESTVERNQVQNKTDKIITESTVERNEAQNKRDKIVAESALQKAKQQAKKPT